MLPMKRNLLHIGLFGFVLAGGVGLSGGLAAAPVETGVVVSVTLAVALERAWSAAPEQALATGREAQAQVLQRHADALLPQAPNLALSGQAGSYAQDEPSGTYSE